jgi:predicted esterase
MQRCTAAIAALLLALLGTALAAAEEQTAEAAEPEPSWCAPELEALSEEMCAYTPAGPAQSAPRVLVIYLHGVIQPGTTWQWTQERAMVRHAKVHGFTVITPRGRRGIGPKTMRDWWTWPTSVRAQAQVEDELIHEWMLAKALLEVRSGQRFERTYVIGFSNGAYYAAALALRGKLPVDGYAMLAGGSAGYLRAHANKTRHRPPIYVGYGQRDSVGDDCRRLGATLRALGWPYRLVGRPGVGHTITDSQVREALELFERMGRPQR